MLGEGPVDQYLSLSFVRGRRCAVVGEIQSIEISYLVHETEDLERITRTVSDRLGVGSRPVLESFEGHFGNRIVRATHQVFGNHSIGTFEAIARFLGSEGVEELLSTLDEGLDRGGALHF